MNTAIIAAGGTGVRMGGTTPKQFMDAEGRPLIVYALEMFNRHDSVDEIIVVCPDEYRQLLLKIADDYGINKLARVAPAGSSRQASVYNGLIAASPDTRIVLVHDAARPLVTGRMITNCIESAERYGACGTVIPAEDTVIESADGLFISSMPPRTTMYNMQTPQCFNYAVLLDAHGRFLNAAATDDCRLAIDAGYTVALVKGDKSNLKITTAEDLILFRELLEINKNRL